MLQQCPAGCLAFLQRKHIEQHLRECPRKVGHIDGENLSSNNNSPIFLEQNIGALRSALHEEIRQRHRLIGDIGELRRQNQHFDNWIEQIDTVHRNLTKSLSDEKSNRISDTDRIQKNLEQLEYQYTVVL